ncbi:MAG: hypothetical protein NC432_06635 [Roseburia sp.]|nr:hypothetical protein [Roseburia sp.]MCM1097734.1 hypothetical protein [Ruminococcus flavefaciens]
MVATFLQDDLVEELKTIFKDLHYKTPGGELSEINVFPQALPIPGPAEPPEGEAPEYLEEGLGATDPVKAEDPYPYAIVRIEDGKIEAIDGNQAVTVLIILGAYNDDLKNQGHKDILNMIQKIYERFAKNAILAQKYELVHPITWTLQEEESYPYFIGGVALTFNTLEIRREDPYV